MRSHVRPADIISAVLAERHGIQVQVYSVPEPRSALTRVSLSRGFLRLQ